MQNQVHCDKIAEENSDKNLQFHEFHVSHEAVCPALNLIDSQVRRGHHTPARKRAKLHRKLVVLLIIRDGTTAIS